MKTSIRNGFAAVLVLAFGVARAEATPAALASWSGSIPATSTAAEGTTSTPTSAAALSSWSGSIQVPAEAPEIAGAETGSGRDGQVLASWTGAIDVG